MKTLLLFCLGIIFFNISLSQPGIYFSSSYISDDNLFKNSNKNYSNISSSNINAFYNYFTDNSQLKFSYNFNLNSFNNFPNANNNINAIEIGYAYNFDDETFDVIVGSSVLHHLDIDKALKEIYRLLKKGGSLKFTEPNMLNPQIALQKNIPYIKKKLGDSPDETAFVKWFLKKKLLYYGFSEIYVAPFDFLHPQTPRKLIPYIEKIGYKLENIPLIKEIAGSLFISAKKLN